MKEIFAYLHRLHPESVEMSHRVLEVQVEQGEPVHENEGNEENEKEIAASGEPVRSFGSRYDGGIRWISHAFS